MSELFLHKIQTKIRILHRNGGEDVKRLGGHRVNYGLVSSLSIFLIHQYVTSLIKTGTKDSVLSIQYSASPKTNKFLQCKVL